MQSTQSLEVKPNAPNCASYTRRTCSSREALKAKILQIYGVGAPTHRSEVFPSGVCAITSVFSAVLEENYQRRHLWVISDELYCDTTSYCKMMSKVNSLFQYRQVDTSSPEALVQVFRERGSDITLFFVETCSNPTGSIFDFSLLPKLKQLAPNCLFVLDNTWNSAAGFNPFVQGADIIDVLVESMSKYVSAGTHIGGLVVAKSHHMDKVDQQVQRRGLHVSPSVCSAILPHLDTLEDRTTKTGELAVQVVEYLEHLRNDKHKLILRIFHSVRDPLYQKYLKKAPGVVLFFIATPCNRTVLKSLSCVPSEYLNFATSYGSAHSKIDQYCKTGRSSLYDKGETDLHDDPYGVWIRLAIGYADSITTIKQGIQWLLTKAESKN